MSTAHETSDDQMLDLLRRAGSLSVGEMAAATAVTATAVRQRLARLMAQGLVDRQIERSGRGRPSHRYLLTEKARRQGGSNFADLALALWREVRAVRDPEVRRGLLERVATAMVAAYRDRVGDGALDTRLDNLRQVFAERRIPLEIEVADGRSQLRVLDCPYPELAEEDRGICAVEKMLFAELLDEPVRLGQCRLDGHACCQFQTS